MFDSIGPDSHLPVVLQNRRGGCKSQTIQLNVKGGTITNPPRFAGKACSRQGLPDIETLGLRRPSLSPVIENIKVLNTNATMFWHGASA
jgi:hypothetical protein